MLVGPTLTHWAVPAAGGSVLRTASRSRTSEKTGASRTGHVARFWNQLARALWFERRGTGGPSRRCLRGPEARAGSGLT
jgi:hypothetical protein